MATKPYYRALSFVIVLIFHSSFSYSAPSSSSDTTATLLKFKEGLKDENGALSSWNPSTPPCFGIKNNWAGIICSRAGSVWGLRLENMGLSGSIDADSLYGLSKLRSISVMNNSFGGPMPDFKKLKLLRALFLSNNKFEGNIDPSAFEGMRRLRKVELANNKFTGKIPNSLVKLNKLVEMRLEGNQFQGSIPDFAAAKNLKNFNVSNNQFEGSIPVSLARFDPSVFAGNKELCGSSMDTCSPPKQISSTLRLPPPSTPPPPPSESPLGGASSPPLPMSSSGKPIPIVAIVSGVVIAMALAILVILMVLRNRCDKHEDNGTTKVSRALSQHHRKSAARKKNIECPDEGSHHSMSSSGSRHSKITDSGKLTFIKEDRERFDLPDLLKAAAEILGSGCFGSSYKATLSNGSAVVVKRFKQMNNVGREEFQEHMRRLGRLSHPNLLPLVAYYYRREEKLFITDPIIPKGSLAFLLHGQNRGKRTLDWPTRLKAIKGVARGLSYLYKELHCLIAPHGHLKSSNVLLNESFEPILSDYGLIPLINQESTHQLMVAYKSPEYIKTGRITKKTDVWALGILIIEILTGKSPSAYLKQGNHEVDMESWVSSMVKDGFDKNIGETTTKNNQGEMQKLLDIGRACCENEAEKRLDIKEACDQIEEIREGENIISNEENDDFYSTVPDTRSSRGTSDEFTTVSIN
ncbi:hypothetical protein Cgig2_020736 [Carnegiea gigantea]|uniref:Protein kinase domain-containing protein n=1 Tax=Carnegiea gigantea TaxID=171969 RepID=A0A9Q1GM38_9CARY|nr:hypothetical protein Cgig2_020736 [Carnegiea gigantea]